MKPEQRDALRRCLGLDYREVAYRNYKCFDERQPLFEELVDLGLMVRRDHDGATLYHATRAGFAAVLTAGESADEDVIAGMARIAEGQA